MPRIQPLPGNKLGQTITDKLLPMSARLRQLATNMGIRRYRVFICRVAWSGAREGEGDFTYEQRAELLPTPKVSTFLGSRKPVDTGGEHESADVTLSKIPFKHVAAGVGYTEDDLSGNRVSNPLAENEQVWYELQEDSGENLGTPSQPLLRRFKMVGIPNLNAGGLFWEVQLAHVEQPQIGPESG